MKIMHIISGGDVGGAKTHVLSLLAGLAQTETVHMVCFMEGPFAQEARELKIPITVIENNNLLQVRNRILSMIRAEGYEIIHCHGARANLMGMLLKKKARIPVISTVHSDYRLDYMGRPMAALTFGNINKLVLPHFDGWVGVSHTMSKLLCSRGFDVQHIYTLYNGVDFSQERPVVSREEYFRKIGLHTESDSVVYGIAARINPVKDMTTLVKAFAQALKERPSLRLIIAGEGEQEAEIKALARELCPQGTVVFAGWEKDIDSFYHALDVNLLTSVSETFPYALTEGARMHCATVSSIVGGVPYLIDHGQNGLLFEAGDIEALRDHMLYLADHAEERIAMGHALYEKTRTHFSLPVMIQKQRDIYASILRRKARKGKRDGALICGAYGKGNRGDNAILSAIIGQLEHIDPELPITVLSRDPKETRLCAQVPSVYTFRPLKSRRILRHSDLYISGGGTLMQDATSTRSLLYYLYSIKQAKKAGCKVMLYGCGIGPIHREKNRKRTAKVLNACADTICVRDHYSLDFLKELGVTKPKIRLTADPALLIDA
ncbi:MAG: polysaccharide pyruvyl transferase family protein [Oscillospiraceae bacterium]|nr:polysaccharide pyruvyl transferase family protein [Oscillospiraceae bacterium]